MNRFLLSLHRLCIHVYSILILISLQAYSDRIEQVFVAYDLYKKGMEAFEFGCLSDALPALQSCYQIRTKAMYAHHREVTEVADQLARCYAMMGAFSESAQYLKVCLPAIQER